MDITPVPLDLNGPTGCAFESFSEADVATPIGMLFERVAGRHAERVAVDDGQVRFSYAESLATVRRLAAAIRAAAPAAEGPIALALPNSAFYHLALLGCFVAGRPAVPLDLHWPRQRCADILLASSPVLALVDPRAGGTPPIPPGTPILDVRAIASGAGNSVAASGASADGGAVSTLDPAVVLYTSGSTGKPKGVVNHQRALVQRVAQYTNASHLHAEDGFLTLSTPCTIAGLREALTALLVGATLHVADFQRLGVGGTLDLMRERRITIYNSVPAVLRLLLRAPEAEDAFAAVRAVRTGGEITFWSDVTLLRRRLGPDAHIQIGFSSTEATGTQWFVPASAQPDGPRVPVGYMLPGNRFMLLAGDTEDAGQVACGETGLLLLRSAALALGHWEGGRCVPGPMRPDPADPLARIFNTGDLMRLRPDGLLDAVGRADDQVKIRGQRVEPSEIEAVLRGTPKVSDAAVVVRREPGSEAAIVAFFTASPSCMAEDLATDLRARLQATLPSAMQPARLHHLPEIPRLPSAKADRGALEQLDRTRARDACDAAKTGRVAGPLPPRTPMLPQKTEQGFARAWRRLLGRRSLAADLHFNEAGGDSLRLLHLIHEVERSIGYGFHLPLELFEAGMRPSEFRAALAQAHGLGLDPAPVEAGDPRPLVCLFPGVEGDEPVLALFRTALKDTVRFALIQFPDWRAMARPGFGFEHLTDSVVAQVEAAVGRNAGPIRLAGYSFGGRVAFAAAARLQQQGRAIESVCLFDCPAAIPPLSVLRDSLRDIDRTAGMSHSRRLVAVLRRQRKLLRVLLENRVQQRLGIAAADTLSRARMALALRFFARVGRLPVPAGAIVACEARLERLMRLRLSQQPLPTRPRPLGDADVTLLRSEEHAPDEAWDLGWAEHAPQIRVVPVPGTHHSMFEGSNRPVLLDQFRQAIGLAPKEPARQA